MKRTRHNSPTVTLMAVDPGGVSGALARGYADLVTGELYDIHSIRISKNTWPDILNWIREDIPDFTLLEHVHSYAGQGVSSSFKFGRGLGLLEGLVMGTDLRHEKILPLKWQTILGVQSKPKTVSKAQKVKDKAALAAMSSEEQVEHKKMLKKRRSANKTQHKRDLKEAAQKRWPHHKFVLEDPDAWLMLEVAHRMYVERYKA